MPHSRIPVFASLTLAAAVAAAVIFGAAKRHSTALAAAPVPAPEPLIGLNLPAVADWSTDAAYVDAKAYLRRWGNVQQPWKDDPSVKLNADRYPLTPAAAMSSLLGYPDGVYTVRYQGSAVVTLGGIASPLTLQPPNSSGAVRLHHGQPAGVLSVAVVPRDPRQPLSNFRLLSPGYPPDTRQVFRNEYLNDVRRAAVLRFMDPMLTNNSPVQHWADRTPATAFYKTSFEEPQTAGIPYEDIITLCNATHTVPWICVPDQADDDYVRQLAGLFRDGLDKKLTLVVEWSNEPWNAQFKQFHRAVAKGKLNDQLTAKDDFGRAAQQAAFEAVRLRRIFDAEYGPRKASVRVVLCGQAAWTYFCQTALEWMAAKVGPPADYIEAIGIAPYFSDSWDRKEFDQPGLTADQLFAGLAGAVRGSVRNWMTSHKTLADQYGVRLYAYEAGQHVTGAANEPVKRAAQTDPRMGRLYADMATQWKEIGGSVMCLYHYCGPSGQWGYWGLKQAADDTNAPKWNAFVEIATKWNAKRP